MALTQGAPLPSVTTTTTAAQQAPEYYTQYLSSLSQAGQQAMARPAGQMVAGYDPMQTQGYGQVPGAAQAYQPGLSAAQQTAAQAAEGVAPRISSFMNPYTQQVVDEMARLSQQNVQRNIMPTLKAGFVGSGGLGGQRYAGALGQTMADIQANLTGQQAGALQKGYSDALQAALQETQLQRQAAETQGSLAGKAQEYGLTGAGALTKAGAERQAYEQSLLDAPLRTATSAAGLLKGYTYPISEQKSVVAPGHRGQFGLSTLDQIAGILSLIGATQGGTTGTGGTAQSIGYRSIADWLGRNVPSSISDLFGTGNASPEAQQGLADFILGYTPENYG